MKSNRKHLKICIPIQHSYIDDLCVDETCRGKGYGRLLYAAVKSYAQSIGAYHITLNVWACNPSAAAFYASIGLKPMKTMLEEVL